eukprot:2111195-Rhodomonas_salina.1
MAVSVGGEGWARTLCCSKAKVARKFEQRPPLPLPAEFTAHVRHRRHESSSLSARAFRNPLLLCPR